DLDVHHREAGEHAVRQGFLQALVDRRDEFARHGAALDGVDEFVALAGFVRLELDPHVTVLATTAGLLGELAFLLHRLADGFAVGHLRGAHVGFTVEFALHAIDDDFEVQLAHAGDDGLAGFFVGTHAEGRIFLSQTTQGDAHLLLVALGLGFDSNVDHRLREFHALENDRLVQITQGFTGRDVLQTDGGGDVAGAHFFDLVAIVGAHLHQTADTFLLALDGVINGSTLLEHARVNADEGELTDEG